MSDLTWPVDSPNAMDLASMKRSLHMHRQRTETYTTRVQQEADLYANTSCMAACKSMQEALAKFGAKCEFLKRAYAQIIAMDAASFERYNKENQDVIDLALKVNSKAGKSIKNTKQEALQRDKSVRVLNIDATLIKFRE